MGCDVMRDVALACPVLVVCVCGRYAYMYRVYRVEYILRYMIRYMRTE